MKDKQGKNDDGYTIIFLLIIVIVLYASCLVMLSKATAWKDIYAAGCSIVGGIVGGLLTLQGVKQTIYAQREITLETIQEQRKQDGLRLIPEKIVALHNLTTEIESFHEKVKELTFLPKYETELENEESFSQIDISKDMNTKVDELTHFFSNLNEIEYKFVEIVSKVDVDTYRIVKVAFDRVKQEYRWLLASDEMRYYMNEVYSKLDIGAGLFIEYTNPFICKLHKFGMKARGQFEELKNVIPLKLHEYEKEME